MKRLTSWLAVGICTMLLGISFATTVDARSPSESATLDITEPVDVGGTILQPGSYQIEVVPTRGDRNMLQVWTADRKSLITTLLSIPHHEGPGGEQVPESRFVYYPANADQVKALRTWFASFTPESGGHDIVYPKRRAMELAAQVEEPVVAVPDEVQVAEYETVPLVVVTPEMEVEPYEEVPVEEPERVQLAENRLLPQTASTVPLYAGLGLLSLLAALGLGVLARRLA